MKILNVAQGSDEWLAIRAEHYTASEAPAMMGSSKYQSRSELLRQKATGATTEVNPAQQRVFDHGHAAEAGARPIVERRIGDELFPVTVVDGPLLASLDGMTMDRRTIFEHKLWNAELAASVKAGELAPHYYWQLEQQLLVTGAQKCLFVVSDGTEENFELMTYVPVAGRAEQLLAGWEQFRADLAAYKADDTVVATAGAIDSLPALTVELSGEVKNTNLATWQQTVATRIAAINTDLQTDQDFADADAMVKFLNAGEKEIETVKKQALAQTASIDELFRTVDHLSEQMRSKRLELTRLVKARKDAIRVEIKDAAQAEVDAHLRKINESLGGKVTLPVITADFAGAMRGKKTVATLRDACDSEVARVKIAASMVGDKIRSNVELLRKEAKGLEKLFADAQTLVMKEPDDLLNLVKLRISEHQAEVERLAAEKAEQARQAEAQAAATAQVTDTKPLAEAPAPKPNVTPLEVPRADTTPAETPDRDTIIWLVSHHYGLSTAAAERAIYQLFSNAEMANRGTGK